MGDVVSLVIYLVWCAIFALFLIALIEGTL